MKVLVVGYGSIGKRHVKNLLNIGIKPYVLTKYQDSVDAVFIDKLPKNLRFDYTIIASPTARHLSDLSGVIGTECKQYLIEKPLEVNMSKCRRILEIADQNNLNIYCAYNLRFYEALNKTRKVIENIKKKICIVQITCGQFLPEWRENGDYRNSYSSIRSEGGGADLDISHEIDYMCWLFGYPEKVIFIKRDKLSNLSIDSPDYFFGMYRYNNFIVNIELDYIRKKERRLKIIGENTIFANIDFINKKLLLEDKVFTNTNYFDLEKTYQKELKEFLGKTPKNNLATVNDGINVVKLLKL